MGHCLCMFAATPGVGAFAGIIILYNVMQLALTAVATEMAYMYNYGYRLFVMM